MSRKWNNNFLKLEHLFLKEPTNSSFSWLLRYVLFCPLVAKSCPTLFVNPWTARFLCPWDFPGKNTGVGCYFLLWRAFLTQGWNPCLLHQLTDSLPLSHHESPLRHQKIIFIRIMSIFIITNPCNLSFYFCCGYSNGTALLPEIFQKTEKISIVSQN